MPLSPQEQVRLSAAAFAAAPWPALILDGEDRLILANEAAEALLGSAIGLLRRPRPPVPALIGVARQARRVQAMVLEAEVEVVIPDLPPFTAALSATPLAEGQVLIGVNRAASPGRSAATPAALKSAAGLGRTLAHEVKNPLAGIRGAAQLLKATAGADEASLAQLIIDETDRIRRLVDRVEIFSDERPLRAQPVNIHRVLDRVRAVVANSAGSEVRFRERYDPSLPHALGDEDQLIQVFLNLVKNAAEAAEARGDGRGEIVLATAYRHDPRSRAGGPAAAPLEVVVQDNGPGVAPDLKGRIFDAFVTTKPAGTGLGLTLVAKLVEDHRGRIELDSEPGRTVFRVRLPVQTAASPHRSAP